MWRGPRHEEGGKMEEKEGEGKLGGDKEVEVIRSNRTKEMEYECAF